MMPEGLQKGEWTETALRILRERYLVKDETPEEMCWRVAYAIALAEKKWGATDDDVMSWARQFYDLMVTRQFMPNSPTLMNAGRGSGLQYSACYVLPVEDSIIGIFDAIKNAAIIHQGSGGTGFSFSHLRPRDSKVKSSGGKASGPVSFLRVFNQATEAVKHGGGRRGANMGILRVDHPDLLEFIDCKLDGGITNFNISVAATDKFMQAVKDDTEYDLIDPHTEKVVRKLKARDVYNHIAKNAWSTGDPGFVFIDRINQRPSNPVPELMQIEATNPCVTGDTLVMTDSGEQRIDSLVGKEVNVWNGVEFSPVTPMITGQDQTILRVSFSDGSSLTCTPYHKFYVSFNQQILVIDAHNLLRGMFLETFMCPDGTEKTISVVSIKVSNKVDTVYCFTEEKRHRGMFNGIVTGQCGEIALGPYEACNLGSLNLTQFISPNLHFIEWDKLAQAIRLAVRFLDDVIEVNPFPLPEIKKAVEGNRRIGLGVMGWADILFMQNIPYNSDIAVKQAKDVMEFITNVGHDESERLAVTRGAFTNWSHSIYKDGKPLRNATVTAIAPTGTISIIANASSGIEPLFALAFSHNVDDRHMSFVNSIFEQTARERNFYTDELMAEVSKHGMLSGIGSVPIDVREVFVTAHEVSPEWHVKIQSAFQAHTDNCVSKTINMTHDATDEDVANAYMQAYDSGCLGITVYRDGCKTDQVLQVGTKEKPKSKSRPTSLKGTTYRKVTPLGTAYVTVNEDDKGQPFELFVTVGKAGSDTASLSEAMGRLISLCLRVPSGLTERERLNEVVEQLQGIGGAHQLGFGKQRVRSLPDGLGQVLSEYLGAPHVETVEPVQVGDLCPECGQATFVYTEGCHKCFSCGHSEC